MYKKPRKLKKLFISLTIIILFIIISAITNPTKQDYIKFDEAQTGISIPESARIAEADFFIFSIYAPTLKNTVDEYGIVHIGFMGQFFQITDGQYDESVWDDFLK